MNSHLPFSDYWRFNLLYKKGGIWMDLDMIALRKFPFEKYDYVFSSEATVQSGTLKSKNKQATNIGVLKAPKGSEFYKKLIEKCEHKMKSNGIKKKTTLMKLLRDMIDKYNYQCFVQPPLSFCPIHWWHTKELFQEQEQDEIIFREKWGVPGYNKKEIFDNPLVYTIHYWRSIARNRHKISFN